MYRTKEFSLQDKEGYATMCSDMIKLTVSEVQSQYDISRTTLYHLGLAGALTVEKEIRHGRAVNLYSKEQIEELLKRKQGENSKNPKI